MQHCKLYVTVFSKLTNKLIIFIYNIKVFSKIYIYNTGAYNIQLIECDINLVKE